MNPYRTHNCAQLQSTDIGQVVKLAGWIDTIRDHGGVTFIHLRDHYGITQIVINDTQLLKGVTRECVVSVEGLLRERDEQTFNSKLATGQIELSVQKLTVLGDFFRRLPFEINESTKTREDLRLSYRFLDLRNPDVHNCIIKRSEITNFIRQKMIELGFVEIQTPILTSSSPEGARDYLVPSRKHPGSFYALPQAPQIFKQLLMVSGFDRYFQIAPCFRDEDARADRSPGEFYQLDFEMAFATQQEVFGVAEDILYDTFSKFSTKKISPKPFVCIPYEQAIKKYGTDKPDLRNPLVISDLSDFFANVDFVPFKGRSVRGIVAPNCATAPKSFFEKLLQYATDTVGMKGLGYISVADGNALKGPIVKYLNDSKQQYLIEMLQLAKNDTLFFICDKPDIVDHLAGQIRTELGKKLGLINEDMFSFCFITDFPMYKKDALTGKIEFTHNPFSMPQGGLQALETKEPLEIKAYQYDIVCNGVELSSGAVRNHIPQVMEKAFEIAGYKSDYIQNNFGALFEAFHYGAPPHAGMAPGLDRIVMLLTNQQNIREVVAFPMNANAQDLLMKAPNQVSPQQLKEAHIKVT